MREVGDQVFWVVVRGRNGDGDGVRDEWVPIWIYRDLPTPVGERR